ncbi:MAG: hypothetical protein A2177_16755 [Spirochaetes bacterium RBG_13_68_11]|nr:MAG: hypothetical protein A2177_16755 [Spirochaetes bacterium RBG_13_68_11]
MSIEGFLDVGMHACYWKCMRTHPAAPSLRHAVALGLLALALGASPAYTEEAAGAGTAWTPQETLRVGFEALIGYYLPEGYEPGFDLAGPSWGIAISFAPFILQTPAFQLAARVEADLISVILFKGGKEGQVDAGAGLTASFGRWRRLAPFLTGEATLLHYSITTPTGVEAGENGWGYRFGAGLHIRVGAPQSGSDSINQFITPGVYFAQMYLETVDISYWLFQVAFTGFMGI